MTSRQATFAAFISFGPAVGLWSGSVPVFAAASDIGPAGPGFAITGIGTAAIVPCSFAIATRMPGLGAAQAIGLLGPVSALPRVPQPPGFGGTATTWGVTAGHGLNAALMLAALGPIVRVRRTARETRRGHGFCNSAGRICQTMPFPNKIAMLLPPQHTGRPP